MLQYPLLFYSKQFFVNYSTSFVNHPFIVPNSWSLLDSDFIVLTTIVFSHFNLLLLLLTLTSLFYFILFFWPLVQFWSFSFSPLGNSAAPQSHRLHSAHSLKQFKLIFEIMKSGLLREETSRFLYLAKSLSTSKMQCEFCLLMRWLKLPVTLLQGNEN